MFFITQLLMHNTYYCFFFVFAESDVMIGDMGETNIGEYGIFLRFFFLLLKTVYILRNFSRDLLRLGRYKAPT